MNTCSLARSRDTRKIKDEVPHLSEEDIGRTPVQIRSIVWIAIYKSKSCKGRGCLEHWRRVRISDKLGEVVVNDGG